MLSDNDKQILNKLKDEYPEAYELFERREEEHRRLLKQAATISAILSPCSAAHISSLDLPILSLTPSPDM